MATKKKYFVQHQRALMHGGRLRTAGDAVVLSEEEAAPYLDGGMLGSEPPEAPAAPSVPTPASGLSQQEQDILAAFRRFDARIGLLEKKVEYLQQRLDEVRLRDTPPARKRAAGGSDRSTGGGDASTGDAADLLAIDGIGPSTLEKLAAVGVETLEDLQRAGPGELAEKTGLPKSKIEHWQQQAAGGPAADSSD